jgi:hypothetical protein
MPFREKSLYIVRIGVKISCMYSYKLALKGKFYRPRLHNRKARRTPQREIFLPRMHSHSDYRTLVTIVNVVKVKLSLYRPR